MDARRDLAKSCMFKVLSLLQLELYPKLCIRTSLKSGSLGSHSLGQKRSGSIDFDHVLSDPPAKPCTNTRSAMATSSGSTRVVNP